MLREVVEPMDGLCSSGWEGGGGKNLYLFSLLCMSKHFADFSPKGRTPLIAARDGNSLFLVDFLS